MIKIEVKEVATKDIGEKNLFNREERNGGEGELKFWEEIGILTGDGDGDGDESNDDVEDDDCLLLSVRIVWWEWIGGGEEEEIEEVEVVGEKEEGRGGGRGDDRTTEEEDVVIKFWSKELWINWLDIEDELIIISWLSFDSIKSVDWLVRIVGEGEVKETIGREVDVIRSVSTWLGSTIDWWFDSKFNGVEDLLIGNNENDDW